MLKSVDMLTISLAVVALTFAGAKPAAALSVEAAKKCGGLTAELANKCRGLALKAHPYKLPGEPGPGNAQAQRDYYSACIAQCGDMPSEPSNARQSKPAPASAPPPSK
jgi:hypothetical protein